MKLVGYAFLVGATLLASCNPKVQEAPRTVITPEIIGKIQKTHNLAIETAPAKTALIKLGEAKSQYGKESKEAERADADFRAVMRKEMIKLTPSLEQVIAELAAMDKPNPQQKKVR